MNYLTRNSLVCAIMLGTSFSAYSEQLMNFVCYASAQVSIATLPNSQLMKLPEFFAQLPPMQNVDLTSDKIQNFPGVALKIVQASTCHQAITLCKKSIDDLECESKA